MSPDQLLQHFRDRGRSVFAEGDMSSLQRQVFARDTSQLLESADLITEQSSWDLAGFGLLNFDRKNFWRCDPLTGTDWGLDYHADVVVYRQGGPDIRVLWELNRFGHALLLARAFAVSGNERYASTLLKQVENWMQQNPYGRGANWNCAMEVALRAINLLAAVDLIRGSKALTSNTLLRLLQFFDQHGKFIVDNSEFSYVSTSNHYLTNVVGLFWIGTLMPELRHAAEWKRSGLNEMLRETDKQVYADGVHFEASTGYHKFVTEMLLYTFLMGSRNGIEFAESFHLKLRTMLTYLKALTRPEGRMTLIGDADGSRVLPIVNRNADDAWYLLALGALTLNEPALASSDDLAPESLWFLGETGISKFEAMNPNTLPGSGAFPDGGSYVMRDSSLYLHFTTTDCGLYGRGSHAHNDALSVEVSAYGSPFIIDPGSCVYNLDREMRHSFRSTSYHSTLMIDGEEQNTVDRDMPFLMGNEARPRVIEWKTTAEHDRVVAEHYGYVRLGHQVTHRRSVEFNKTEKYWLIEDRLEGEGKHGICLMFHIAPGIEWLSSDDETVIISSGEGAQLYIIASGISANPVKMPAFVSRNYGDKRESFVLLWRHMAEIPFRANFLLVPAGPHDDPAQRLDLAKQTALHLSV